MKNRQTGLSQEVAAARSRLSERSGRRIERGERDPVPRTWRTREDPLRVALAITLAGQPFPHLLYQFRLAFSGWRYARAVQGGESYATLSEGLQGALWRPTSSLSTGWWCVSIGAWRPALGRNRPYCNPCRMRGLPATRNWWSRSRVRPPLRCVGCSTPCPPGWSGNGCGWGYPHTAPTASPLSADATGSRCPYRAARAGGL